MRCIYIWWQIYCDRLCVVPLPFHLLLLFFDFYCNVIMISDQDKISEVINNYDPAFEARTTCHLEKAALSCNPAASAPIVQTELCKLCRAITDMLVFSVVSHYLLLHTPWAITRFYMKYQSRRNVIAVRWSAPQKGESINSGKRNCNSVPLFFQLSSIDSVRPR